MKIITYVLLGLFLALGGVTSVLWFQSGQQADTIEAQRGELQAVQQTLAGTEATLTAVKEGMVKTDTQLLQLGENLSRIDGKATSVVERIYHIRETNDEARAFLDTALGDTGCLLDDTCSAPDAPGSGGQAGGSSAGPLSTAQADPNPRRTAVDDKQR